MKQAGDTRNEGTDAWSAALVDKDRNSFDAIRLILASLVVFVHSFFLVSNSYQEEPFHRLTNGQFNAGSLAVCMFFAISGFLVTRSYVLTADLRSYLGKRVARIVPGFLVASFVGYVILAPAVAYSAGQFFAEQNWLRIVAQALTLQQAGVNATLDGNAVRLIHGTLWTIKYEFDCYLAVALLGVLGLLTPGRALYAYGVIIGALVLAQAGLFGFPVVDHGVLALAISNPVQWPFLFLFFFVGSAFYMYRRYIPKSVALCALAAAAILVTTFFGGLYWAVLLGGTYLILYAALSSAHAVQLFGRRVDLSYGVYLYGWPVGQVLLYAAGQQLSPWPLFAATLVISYAAAFASWCLIEHPSLVRQRRTRLAASA